MNKKERWSHAQAVRKEIAEMPIVKLERLLKVNTLNELAEAYDISFSLMQKIIAIKFSEGHLINLRAAKVFTGVDFEKTAFSESEFDYGRNSDWDEFKKQFVIL